MTTEAIDTEVQTPAVAAIPEQDVVTIADVTGDEPIAAEESKTDAEYETKEPLRDEKGKFKGVQSRIDELTRDKHAARREAEYWKGLATQSTAQSTAEVAAKPTADQFDDYADYVEALTDWKVEQKTRDVATKAVAGAEIAHRQSAWVDRQIAARASLPDYDTVVGTSDIPVAEHVRDALLDSERGPELAYHLASNPEFATQLNSMSPTRAALELGRLESSLDVTPAPKPISKAPAPITPITTGTNVKIDLSKASMDDYIAERRKQGASF